MPAVAPKAWAHEDGGSSSPSQNPGWVAICCRPEMQWPPAAASNTAWGERVLANRAWHALPSPGSPAAAQQGM